MIVALPHSPGSGGPGSFQSRFEAQLRSRGVEIVYLDELDSVPDVVLIVGGTRKLSRIWRLRRLGVPIIVRLDGILWLHRKRWPGLRNFLRKEIINLIYQVEHAFLADVVVYQSEFVKRWWARKGWRQPSASEVISNGVDQSSFIQRSLDEYGGESTGIDVLCLEGHIDYSPYAVSVLNELAGRLIADDVNIRLYGNFADDQSRSRLTSAIDYRGFLDRHQIHEAYRNAVYLSLDVNPACPNTVIEAMSSGLPVVGFDTGALSELVPGSCGQVVAFGGDPWELDKPDVDSLHEAIREVIANYDEYAANALAHARGTFDIQQMTNRYLQIFDRTLDERS